MTVTAVGQNEHSYIGTVVTSTAVGAGVGYTAKYIYPITKQEDTFNRRVMINYCRKVTNKAKVQEFKEMPSRTPAQDTFVNMIEAKDENAFSKKYINDKVKTLGGEESAAAKEFRTIIKDVNNSSKEMIKRWAIGYHIMLKKIRPTVPFLVAGAGVGFLTGFMRNVLRTDA